jgi:hypothetical protein
VAQLFSLGRLDAPLMGKTKGPMQAEFPVGTTVRIAERSVLERFQQEWRFHNPLQIEQLDFAGRIATVRSAGYYFGGDELYWLEGIPGTWHECCLSQL